ncbi:MAG: hypothetical protein FWE71_08325 [Nocardioidaceae bacterium]|nr:hypothetical protein [Nocardioidaceae bacterium]MCL2614496.1 hypothetical protein [Nocardioidaceae bacterium]
MSHVVQPRPRTLWEAGREPGREVAALTVALLLSVTVVEVGLSARLGLLFDLVFVALCLYAALAVRPPDFFTIGVLPPLAMLGTVALLGLAQPAAVARSTDGLVQATVTGLSHHALALVVGYLTALAVLAVRRRVLTRTTEH